MSRWITQTVRFEPIGITVYKTVSCTTCGKRLRRQKRFEQTLNPFNLKNDREKTACEILEEERAKAKIWQEQGEMCRSCKG